MAKSGWTTADLDSALNERITPAFFGRFALVSLMVGVNDQIQSQGGPEETYRTNIAALLQRAVSLTSGTDPQRVLALSIPDWTATPAGLERSLQMNDGGLSVEGAELQLGRYNTVLQEEAQRAGVRYVDVTAISRESLMRPELTCGDGLHPSADQYGEWAAAALPAVRVALGHE